MLNTVTQWTGAFAALGKAAARTVLRFTCGWGILRSSCSSCRDSRQGHAAYCQHTHTLNCPASELCCCLVHPDVHIPDLKVAASIQPSLSHYMPVTVVFGVQPTTDNLSRLCKPAAAHL